MPPKAKAQQGTRTDLPQNSAEGLTPIETREELAEAAGVSHDTIHKVETIQQSAPGALLESTRAGDVSVHRAYELTKRYLALPDDPPARKWLRQLRRRQRLAQAPRAEADDTFTLPYQRDRWNVALIALFVVIVAAAVFFGYSIYQDRAQSERSAAEYACSLAYERYSPQWQNCVDDR